MRKVQLNYRLTNSHRGAFDKKQKLISRYIISLVWSSNSVNLTMVDNQKVSQVENGAHTYICDDTSDLLIFILI